jgi:peptidoglycan/LPS O-acetylase OafA/YrhL
VTGLDIADDTARMTALTDSVVVTAAPRMPMVGVLRALLLAEAVAGLVLAVVFSLIAGGQGADAETNLRFAAGAAFLFGVFAAIASRGARRRRAWSWTMAAILQVLLAIGTGIAVMIAEWHPIYLAGFAMATAVMLVLSAASVRRALGQG